MERGIVLLGGEDKAVAANRHKLGLVLRDDVRAGT